MIMILVLLITSLGINAGDEVRTIDEYTQLTGSMMELIMGATIDETIDERVLFEAAMEGMFGALDPYSDFMTIEATDEFTNSIETNYVGVGIQLNNVEGKNIIEKVFNGSPAEAAGVRAGDVIISVDGVDTESYDIDALLAVLLGESGTYVDLGVRRSGLDIIYTIGRASITIPTVDTMGLGTIDGIDPALASETAYIQINSFGLTTDTLFTEYMNEAITSGAKYLILDLRDNSGGYTSSAIAIAKALIPAGKVITFVNADGTENTDYSTTTNPPFEKIITLINRNTASSSEILASALQDSGISVMVGENTYGKGISQMLYQVDPEYYIKITAQEFFSRNGNKIHGVGIKPDYELIVPSYVAGDYRLYMKEDNEDVFKMEAILDYLGYDVGVPDTYYDELTYKAVYAFQKDAGLFTYGVADYTTQRVLNETLYTTVFNEDRQLNEALEVLGVSADTN